MRAAVGRYQAVAGAYLVTASFITAEMSCCGQFVKRPSIDVLSAQHAAADLMARYGDKPGCGQKTAGEPQQLKLW